MQQPLLFGQVFDMIFSPDIHGRFSCNQISMVVNDYYDSIGKPNLKLTPRQVSDYMVLQSQLDKTRHNSITYHVSIKPDWPVSEKLLERLGKTSVKKYTKSFIRIGTDSSPN